MLNYTKTGFQKIRAPEKVFRLIEEFWKENRDRAVIEWSDSNPYHVRTFQSALKLERMIMALSCDGSDSRILSV
jgi:hypothetical protein